MVNYLQLEASSIKKIQQGFIGMEDGKHGDQCNFAQLLRFCYKYLIESKYEIFQDSSMQPYKYLTR